MDQPEQSAVDDPAARSDLAAALPRPPFVDPASPPEAPRLARLSPRVAVLIGATIIVGLLLWMARDSIRPFVIGLLLVYLLDPPVRWLVQRGLSRTVSIAIVYVAALVAFIEFLNLTLTPLIREVLQIVDDLPVLTAQFQVQLERLGEAYTRLQIPDAVRDWLDGLIASIGEGGGGVSAIDVGLILPLVTGAGSVIGAIFGYVILPVWVFYLLKDRATLVGQFERALPPTWRFDTWAVIRLTRRVMGQWVRAQLILGFTVGIMTFIGLTILSATIDPIFGRYAVLLSVIAGILELVPIIGPIIAAVPAVLLAATAGIESVVAALVLYTLVQQLENNFLVPKIQGDAVELHPAAVIFAIIVGGALAGLLGAILALPLLAAFRDVVRYLFRRASPDASGVLAASLERLGMADHPGLVVATDPPPEGAGTD